MSNSDIGIRQGTISDLPPNEACLLGELAELRRKYEAGEVSDIIEDAPEPEPVPEPSRRTPRQPRRERQAYAPPQPQAPAAPPVPDEIQRVLDGPHKGELLAIAKSILDTSSERHLVFDTSVGAIKVKYLRSNCILRALKEDDLFFMMVKTVDLIFEPKVGTVMSVSDVTTGGEPVELLCIQKPMRMYNGIDLVCFISQTTFMEKNGSITEDTPSAVSGKKSYGVVNADGEPVADGEKIASIADIKFDPYIRSVDNDE